MTTMLCIRCGLDLLPECFERRADTGTYRREWKDCRAHARRSRLPPPRVVPPPEPLDLAGFLPLPLIGEPVALTWRVA